MDESGYWFRMQPDRRLCTEQLEGIKKDKSRVTIVLTCNGTGTDKLPPWIIGIPKNPRCFKNINIHAMGMVYRNNRTAWMKTEIMIEFLLWFDRRMAGRKVVLLMDNFSAHECGVREIGGETGLKNTRIVFLPANTTTKWQPLDQGIISAWKAHTRRHHVRYLVKKLENLPATEDSKLPKITLLQAIRWAVSAWIHDVKPSTIYNCFTKSTVKIFEPGHYQLPPHMILEQNTEKDEDIAETRRLVGADLDILRVTNHILEIMDIDQFLNPGQEKIDDDIESLDVSFEH